MAKAKASSPWRSVGAGVLRYSSRMQKTRPERAARVPCHSRSAMIFSRGTRSAGAAPCGNDDFGVEPGDVFGARSGRPGSPKNSPPAASTNSATQVWEAISGLPHSSQNTRGRARLAVRARTSSIRRCMRGDNLFAAIDCADRAGDGGDVGIDVRQDCEGRGRGSARPTSRISLTAFSW